MRKKFLCLILCLAAIGLAGCGNSKKSNVESTTESTQELTTTEEELTEEVTTQDDTEQAPIAETENVETSETDSLEEAETPADSGSYLSEEEALQLLYDSLGTEDEETGNAYSFGYIGNTSVDEAEYLVFDWRWMVDNDHLSRIGDLFVAADGSGIYEGIYSDTESQVFTENNYK